MSMNLWTYHLRPFATRECEAPPPERGGGRAANGGRAERARRAEEQRGGGSTARRTGGGSGLAAKHVRDSWKDFAGYRGGSCTGNPQYSPRRPLIRFWCACHGLSLSLGGTPPLGGGKSFAQSNRQRQVSPPTSHFSPTSFGQPAGPRAKRHFSNDWKQNKGRTRNVRQFRQFN